MKPSHDPFGVLAFLHWHHDWNNWHFNDELLVKGVKQLHALGIGYVRLDVLWSDVHQGFHQYDFSRYDRIVSLLHDHGIRVLGLLHYNKERLDRNGKEIWNRPPDSFDEFAAYVGATVDRYKNWIAEWEIWNEPNHPIYWTEPKNGLKKYLELLRVSYQAAKKADPKCRVLNGGLAEPVLEDLENLYQNGDPQLWDVLAIHVFIDPHHKDREKMLAQLLDNVQKIMDRHADRHKKVWITELGCPGVPNTVNTIKWFGGDHVTESQQAEWLETVYQKIQNYPVVEKLFWAFYRDTTGMFKDGTDYLGLVRFDLSPKPAFETMKALIQSRNGRGPK